MTKASTRSAGDRILLVGDETETVRALQQTLSKRWTVEIAGDAAAAVEGAGLHAAVVADSRLLQEDDWRLLRRLRVNGARAHTPVIAITRGSETAALCLSAGVDDCVVHPVSPSELEARVVARLELSRVRADSLLALQALRRQLDDVEAVNHAKDRLMATLGHELRNPLSAIRRALEVMRVVGNDSREQAVIERQTRHMIRLVEDLLDAARIKGGKMSLDKHRADLSAVVQGAVEMVSPLLKERRQHVEIRLPAGLYAMMDASRMRQVVCNLLENAAKYSEPGSRIVIFGERRAGALRFKVIDQGMGIDRTMLEQIFEVFVRQRDSDHRAADGLGIGLSIVRNIVEQHGGSVHAHSPGPGPGRGSEFVIQIPGCE